MLQKLREWVQLLTAILLCLIAAVILYTLIHCRGMIFGILSHANAAAYNLSLASWQVQEAAADSRPILHATLLHADGLMGESRLTAKTFRETALNVRDQEGEASQATLSAMRNLSQGIGQVSEDSHQISLQTVATLKSVNGAAVEAKDAVNSLDLLFRSPQISNTLNNMDHVTASWASLSSDAVTVERRYFFPAPYSGHHPLWHRIGTGFYTGVKLLGPFSEAAYYTSNVHR